MSDIFFYIPRFPKFYKSPTMSFYVDLLQNKSCIMRFHYIAVTITFFIAFKYLSNQPILLAHRINLSTMTMQCEYEYGLYHFSLTSYYHVYFFRLSLSIYFFTFYRKVLSQLGFKNLNQTLICALPQYQEKHYVFSSR